MMPLALRLAFAFATALASAVAQQITYDNGPLFSADTGGGPTGTSPLSAVQTGQPLQHSTFGYAASYPTYRVTDEFVVASSLRIDAVEVFGYTIGSTAPSCTGVFLSIWDADPSLGNATQVLLGAGPTTNLIAQSVNTFADVYRVYDWQPLATNRRLQSVLVTLPTPVDLPTGTYWLEWSFQGISWVPPLATTNVAVTGNAMVRSGAVYQPILMSALYGQGLPFRLRGLWPTGNSGRIASLGGGCSNATMSVQGSPTLGGYVRSEMANVHAAAFPVTMIGLQYADLSLPGCGCRIKNTGDLLIFGSSYEVQVPTNPALQNAQLFFQGAQIAFTPGVVGCSAGIDFDLTDGFEYSLSTPWSVADLVMFDETEDYTQLMPPSPGAPIEIDIINLGPFDMPHTITWSCSSPEVTFGQQTMTVQLYVATRQKLQLLIGNLTVPTLVTLWALIQGPGGAAVIARQVVVRPFTTPACRVIDTTEGVAKVLPDNETTHIAARGKFWSNNVAKTAPGRIEVLMLYGGFGTHGSMRSVYTCTPTGCPSTPTCNGAATDTPAAAGLPRTVKVVCACQPSS